MSNLGFYQTITTFSKKVGGPKIAVAIVAAAGYGVFRSTEAGTKKLLHLIPKDLIPKDLMPKHMRTPAEGQVFTVTSEGEAGGGLVLRAGDQYTVLERDGDAILIVVVGDTDSPYFVSGALLTLISDFPAQS